MVRAIVISGINYEGQCWWKPYKISWNELHEGTLVKELLYITIVCQSSKYESFWVLQCIRIITGWLKLNVFREM